MQQTLELMRKFEGQDRNPDSSDADTCYQKRATSHHCSCTKMYLHNNITHVTALKPKIPFLAYLLTPPAAAAAEQYTVVHKKRATFIF